MGFGNPARCWVHDDRPDAPIRKPLRPVANSVITNHWLKSRVNRLFTVNPDRSGSRIGSSGLWKRSFGPSSKFDEGPVVYRPPRQIVPVATPRRGFGALGFDPKAQHPERNAPLSAPRSPALSRSLFFSAGLVNRGVPSGGLMRTQFRSGGRSTVKVVSSADSQRFPLIPQGGHERGVMWKFPDSGSAPLDPHPTPKDA